jgi:hypothetical protein
MTNQYKNIDIYTSMYRYILSFPTSKCQKKNEKIPFLTNWRHTHVLTLPDSKHTSVGPGQREGAGKEEVKDGEKAEIRGRNTRSRNSNRSAAKGGSAKGRNIY